MTTNIRVDAGSGEGTIQGQGQGLRSLVPGLDDSVTMDLRGGLDKQAFLTIGDSIEIVVRDTHLQALRDQATALVDIALVGSPQAGADQPAEPAYISAQYALDAAERVQVAMKAASEAMCTTDRSAECDDCGSSHRAGDRPAVGHRRGRTPAAPGVEAQP